MLKKERQQIILDRLVHKKKVTSAALSKWLEVSEDTIRRDLNELSRQGLLEKVHGGALSKSPSLYRFNENNIEYLKEKQLIARKSVELLSKDQVIIISGGTTNFEFIRAIPSHMPLMVYTYSLQIAMILSEKPKVQTIFIGGKLLKDAMVTTGIDVIHALSNIYADYCFLGTSALSVEYGLTEIDYEVCQVKKAMIAASGKVVSLCTHHKLGAHEKFKVCDIDQVDTLVTSLSPKQALEKFPKFSDVKLRII